MNSSQEGDDQIRLSKRELETLKLLAEGLVVKKIPGRLDITINSAKEYLRRIYRKLRVRNGRDAVRWYCEHFPNRTAPMSTQIAQANPTLPPENPRSRIREVP